jgi:hypothetical protein
MTIATFKSQMQLLLNYFFAKVVKKQLIIGNLHEIHFYFL